MNLLKFFQFFASFFSSYCVVIDAGHGGINPHGNYTTSPSKQYKHKEGDFYGEGWFYEGLYNRELAAQVIDKLKLLMPGIKIVKSYHEYEDWALSKRIAIMNKYFSIFKKRYLGISIHANASKNHQAFGYEGYTSPGPTRADIAHESVYKYIADRLVPYIEEKTGYIMRLRADTTDGDHDKEERFALLVGTRGPLVFFEAGFFDNKKEAELLISDEFVYGFSDCVAKGIRDYFISLK